MSLMCSSIDTVNLKKKKSDGGEAYLHSFTFTIFCLNSLQTHWLKKYLQIVELYWRAPFCSGLASVTEQDGSSCPPHTEMEHVATCYMGLKRQDTDKNLKLGCSTDPLCWAEAERGKHDRPAFSLGTTVRAARAFISQGNVRQMDPSPWGKQSSCCFLPLKWVS